MIGIVYSQRWTGAWHCAGIGCLPNPAYKWHCNDSIWLFPWVTQAMCWGDKKAPFVPDVVLS